jgi:small subunit ribosomal protein S3
MGHKVHPYGFRLGIIRQPRGRWFAAGRAFKEWLVADLKVRRFIRKTHRNAAISDVLVDRTRDSVTITIVTAKPGVIIGRGGKDVDVLRQTLEKMTGKKTRVNVEEAREPDLNAQLVAESIARQIERRVSHRWAMRQSVERALRQGAKGIRVKISGRLGGVEIARSESIGPMGRVPLQTLRADIDYGLDVAHTTYGPIGVKVWVYRGDVLPARKAHVEEEAAIEALADEIAEAQRQLHGEDTPVVAAEGPINVSAVAEALKPVVAEVVEAEEGPTAPAPKPITFEMPVPQESAFVAELMEDGEPVAAAMEIEEPEAPVAEAVAEEAPVVAEEAPAAEEPAAEVEEPAVEVEEPAEEAPAEEEEARGDVDA